MINYSIVKRSVNANLIEINPDAERIKQTRADALLLSPMENAGQNNLARLGIPLIQCADYMEVSPLARAEWMRFYGRLFGCADSADSLFREVERAYETLCQKVRTHNAPRPTVFCDLPLSGTWYEPGGQSTMGQYLTDAGADYLWSDRAESGSLPLDFEAVYARAARADFWLVKYGSAATLTYDSMLRDDSRFRRFRAWQERRIWSCCFDSLLHASDKRKGERERLRARSVKREESKQFEKMAEVIKTLGVPTDSIEGGMSEFQEWVKAARDNCQPSYSTK